MHTVCVALAANFIDFHRCVKNRPNMFSYRAVDVGFGQGTGCVVSVGLWSGKNRNIV